MKVQIILGLALIIAINSASYTWMSAVKGYSRTDPSGYTGKMGKEICFVRVSGGTHYRVHTVGGSWLPAVTGNNINDYNNGYAGATGQAIDGFALEGGVKYEVHTLGGSWIGEVTGYNINDAANGYAGILGSPIDAIRINGRTYAAAYMQGGDGGDEQVWVRTGTGLAGIPYQSEIPHMREGCLFMSCCVKGGVGTKAHISAAYTWAVNNGYIRAEDTLVYNCQAITDGVARMWGLKTHPEFNIVQGTNHYYIRNSTGTEVFNSAGLGQCH